ncbi:MAG: methylated-DNA--[protein]-cysteine S-methyltransferase [bacterium]|nr:methylated-DNA--[protein]-cysteine S-methyltransferase [bacterium]
MRQHRFIETRWGTCGYVAGPDGVVASYLPEPDRDTIARRIVQDHPGSVENRSLLPKLAQALTAFFKGRPVEFDLRLDLSAHSSFRRRVLEACRQIPRGQTATYADLARDAGSPNAMRAAGSTMAHNPLPPIVPCHRVIRSDGSIGGFSSPSGVEQKLRLLELENAEVPARLIRA